jgi:hypothetical protein
LSEKRNKEQKELFTWKGGVNLTVQISFSLQWILTSSFGKTRCWLSSIRTATLSGALIGIQENAKTHAWIAGADSTRIEGMFFVKHH